MKFGFIMLLVCGMVTVLAAQNDPGEQISAREKQQFRLAQRYQRSNQHENAAAILKNLYDKHRGNRSYYQELLESYLQLSRIEEALALIEQQRALDAINPRYDIDYASVLYKAEKKEEALNTWNQVIQKYGDNVAIYTMVANALIANRLYDEAVEVYQKAYQQHPDRAFLLRDLANFYQNRLQYTRALEYYLEYVRQEPRNYSSVIRQILSFQLEERQLDSLKQILRAEVEKSRQPEGIQVIAAKFYQKYQYYDEALEIFRRLEDEKTEGKYLIDYARSVQGDSLYTLALEAYSEVINRFPQSHLLLQAYLGAAETNLAIARQKNDQSYARQATEIIHKVQQKYPTHPQIAALILLEAQIHRQFFFDLDRAIEIFLEIAEQYQSNAIVREEAFLGAGESYLMRGNSSDALAVLEKVHSPQKQPRALYYLAKIRYYEGNYDESRELLHQIVELQGLSGEVTNDALELQTILNNEFTAGEALAFYARADWLLLQQKKSEALTKLRYALDKNPPPGFRIQILLKAANLASELGKPTEALEFCNQVLKDRTLQMYADEALFIMAGILYRQLNDPYQAYILYDRLLADFPKSQFVIAARERLKEIRKKNPDIFQ